MKSPAGTLSDRTVLPKARWRGFTPTSSRLWSVAQSHAVQNCGADRTAGWLHHREGHQAV